MEEVDFPTLPQVLTLKRYVTFYFYYLFYFYKKTIVM